MLTYTKALLAEVKAGGEGKPKTFKFRATSGVMDRQDEIVTPDGWQTDTFMLNPVFLVSHDYSSLPVGKVVSISNDGAGLVAEVVFDEDDPEAQKVARKYEAGFLNAVSVGFKSIERTGSWGDRNNPIKHIKKELLEISAVSVPANPEALMLRGLSGMTAKAGRALSQKNQGLIQTALDALTQVMASLGMPDDAEDDDKKQGKSQADEAPEISIDIAKLAAFAGREEKQNG